MKQNTTLPVYAEPVQYELKDLLVAYDFSAAADSSLKYAVMLSKRFGSFIHLIGVQSPAEYASALEAGRSRWKCLSVIFNLAFKKLKIASGQKGYGAIPFVGSVTSQTRLKGRFSSTPPTFFSLALMVTVLLTGHGLAQPPSICCGQSVARYSLWDRTLSSATVKPLPLSGFFVLRAHSTLLTIFSVLLATWRAKWERVLELAYVVDPTQTGVRPQTALRRMDE